MGVAGAGSLSAVINAALKNTSRFAEMKSFFDGVGEGHAAPQHRRAGFMAENDAIACLAQFNGQSRGGFIDPEDDREIAVDGGNEIRKRSRAHGLPPRNPAHNGSGSIRPGSVSGHA
jgi:hypothetical protein